MTNIFLGFLLVLMSLLPAFSEKEELERSFRDRINEKGQVEVETKVNPLPEKVEEMGEIYLSSQAAYFIDFHSGKVLFEKNPSKKVPPASLTKLMVAIVASSRVNPEDIVTVKKQETRVSDATMGLVIGDKIKVEELLHGMLINSGSDATLNLVSHISENEESFTELMNKEASLLGLNNTHFTNPVGWDDAGNYSTAKDLTNLARIALKNENIKKIVNKESHAAKSENNRIYPLRNTNQLLSLPGYEGIKTGTTLRAGECLASYYIDNDKKILGIVLGGHSRFFETRKIIDLLDERFWF